MAIISKDVLRKVNECNERGEAFSFTNEYGQGFVILTDKRFEEIQSFLDKISQKEE